MYSKKGSQLKKMTGKNMETCRKMNDRSRGQVGEISPLLHFPCHNKLHELDSSKDGCHEKTRSTRDIQNAKKPQPSGPLVGLSQSHPQKRRPWFVARLRPSEILESWDFESLTYPHEFSKLNIDIMSFCVPFCSPLVWEPGRTWSIHHPAQTSNLAYLLRTLDEYWHWIDRFNNS